MRCLPGAKVSKRVMLYTVGIRGAGHHGASFLALWNSLPMFKCPFILVHLAQRALVKELPLHQRNFISEMGMICLALKGSCKAQC